MKFVTLWSWRLTHLLIPTVLGLEGDSGIEGKDETDGVCLALETLEDGT
jgi:hypothetical protein